MTVSGFARLVHMEAAPPHAILAPEIVPPAAGVTVREAILPRRRLVPLDRSRSTLGPIPGTRPDDVHCQNVHP